MYELYKAHIIYITLHYAVSLYNLIIIDILHRRKLLLLLHCQCFKNSIIMLYIGLAKKLVQFYL